MWKFRIKEKVTVTGASTFFVQKRFFLLFWRDLKHAMINKGGYASKETAIVKLKKIPLLKIKKIKYHKIKD
jgi:hypothetical protein